MANDQRPYILETIAFAVPAARGNISKKSTVIFDALAWGFRLTRAMRTSRAALWGDETCPGYMGVDTTASPGSVKENVTNQSETESLLYRSEVFVFSSPRTTRRAKRCPTATRGGCARPQPRTTSSSPSVSRQSLVVHRQVVYGIIMILLYFC